MKVQQSNDPACRTRNELSLAGFLARSTVNGPGMRSVVWVQGCPLHCCGCFNKTAWGFSPAWKIHPVELADHILGLEGVEGLTISGGEPFTQAGPLAILGRHLKDAGLTIITYSGFSASHLFRKQRPSWNNLLGVTDLLIAGPFIQGIPAVSTLAGSGNQEIIQLTEAISLQEMMNPSSEFVEYTISPEGDLTITGFPSSQDMQIRSIRCRGG